MSNASEESKKMWLQSTTIQQDMIEAATQAFVEFLPSIETTDPAAFDAEFHKRLNLINDMSLIVPEQRRELMKYLYEMCWEPLDIGALQRQSRNKPLGYPGDYLIIDWIYTKKADSEGVGKLWDEFYHRQAAPQAVRNRKTFFREVFLKLLNDNAGNLSLLNIASGPCRDVKEALEAIEAKNGDIYIHCVDMDANAIAYAKGIMNGVTSKADIQWTAANAFRIKPSRKYDLVWSAGLFDYLKDRYAIALIKRMWNWTKDNGVMIFGNFHPRNPSRNYMEWCGDWFLIHRTEHEMAFLCEQAGIARKCVSFAQEPLGVNIFCVVRK